MPWLWNENSWQFICGCDGKCCCKCYKYECNIWISDHSNVMSFFFLLSLSLSYRTCRPLALDPCRLQCPRLPLGVVAQLLIIWSCFSARSARSNSSSINCWRRSLALASRAAVSCRNWSIWATSLSEEEMKKREKKRRKKFFSDVSLSVWSIY